MMSVHQAAIVEGTHAVATFIIGILQSEGYFNHS
jgi:hypothetical protein